MLGCGRKDRRKSICSNPGADHCRNAALIADVVAIGGLSRLQGDEGSVAPRCPHARTGNEESWHNDHSTIRPRRLRCSGCEAVRLSINRPWQVGVYWVGYVFLRVFLRPLFVYSKAWSDMALPTCGASSCNSARSMRSKAARRANTCSSVSGISTWRPA